MNLTHRELAHVLIGLRLLADSPDVLEGHDILEDYEPMDAGELDDLCEKLNVADDPVIYDALPVNDPNGVMDRYTVFPYPNHPDAAMRRCYLGCSLGGRAVSMWGELTNDSSHGNYAHLGRQVAFKDLDPDTQAHIKQRIAETA